MVSELFATLLRIRGRPGFAVTCTVTLALGIGACATVLSVLNAVVLRPMSYGNPSALVHVWAPHRMFPDLPLNALGPSQADFFDLQRDARTFSAMAFLDVGTFGLATGARTDRVAGASVSTHFFSTLQVQALIGRTLAPGDDAPGQSDVAVISHRLWQRAFGADGSVIGRAVTIDRRPHHIVGVMPPAFRYPRAEDLLAGEVEGEATDLWLPLTLTADQRDNRDFSDNTTLARLATGVSIETAQLELSEIMARLDRTRTPEMKGWSVALRSVEDSIDAARAHMWMLFGAVTLVLIIACSNAAHLMLTRAAERTREMAIRTALGAGRWRVIRQAMLESMALALAGGLAGVALAYGAVRTLVSINPGNVPRLADATVDAHVLLFSLALSLSVGLVLGLVPARWAAGTDANDILLRGQAGHASAPGRRLRASLIVGEVALAMVLMAGASLLLRSWAAIQRVDPGFSRSAVTMRVYLDERYDTPAKQRQFFGTLMGRVRQLPGVEAVGMVDALPLSQTERLSRFDVAGYQNEPGQLVHSRVATPAYFDAIGTSVIDGRSFHEADVPSSSTVVLVNESFARRYFTGRPAVGGRVRFPSDDDAQPPPWATVVGVLADVRHATIEEPALPQVYLPWDGIADRGYLVVRSAAPGSTVVAAVRDIAHAMDPLVPLGHLGSMNDLVDAANARRWFQTTVVAVFAGGALVLAAVGLYGLIVYLVQQRMTEIGIRLALGAQARDVMYLVVGPGIGLTTAGLVLGGVAALLLTRFIQAWLFEVSSGDWIAFSVSSVALLAAALVACYIPAQRAIRADVVAVLRAE